jgi:hypothetical protein
MPSHKGYFLPLFGHRLHPPPPEPMASAHMPKQAMQLLVAFAPPPPLLLPQASITHRRAYSGCHCALCSLLHAYFARDLSTHVVHMVLKVCHGILRALLLGLILNWPTHTSTCTCYNICQHICAHFAARTNTAQPALAYTPSCVGVHQHRMETGLVGWCSCIACCVAG